MVTNSLNSDGIVLPHKASVSIIIPTLASPSRTSQLYRAVESALAGSTTVGRVKVIVCVNGDKWDGGCVARIQSIDGVDVFSLSIPSLPKAVAFGRSKVATDFFGFLDDDDELLPGSLDKRLNVLATQPECDLVVSNGYRRSGTTDELILSRLDFILRDPLVALFEQNWLASCGATFRTKTVSQSYFEDSHDYAEWTWLAYRLALDGFKVAILEEPTFVVNDTAGSLSKSALYRQSYLSLFERMLQRNPPSIVRRMILERMGRSLHDLSVDCLGQGDILGAARLHLRSLSLSGLRFLSYSRHIVRAALTSR